MLRGYNRYLLLLTILLSSCAKEFLNPYDPATPPDSWMPRDFVLDTLDNNSVRLSWQQDELHIDGYTVRRDISGDITEFNISSDSLSYMDVDVIESTVADTCIAVTYSVVARAAENRSDVLTSPPVVFPIVTQANAGQDMTTDLTVNVAANPPAVGETGQWYILSGTGGSFSNPSASNTTFTCVLGESYLLRWQITGVCSSSSDEVAVKPPAIGDTFQGGIVFYLDGNLGGLIAAPSDQSTGAPWGCNGDLIIGADGTAVGTGNQNTIDIEAGCTEAGTAADICANLTLNGYNDWFLPSRDELQLMYQNLHTQGLGNFQPAYYWSSTENYVTNAWLFNFNSGPTSGFAGTNPKYNPFYVRAVRAF